jgi:hypothetical protein
MLLGSLRPSIATMVLVELARKPLRFRRANVSFLAGIFDGLPSQPKPAGFVRYMQHTFCHGRDR